MPVADDGLLPLHADIFSAEQLQAHARDLAMAHVIDFSPDGRWLLRRLADNARVLADAQQLIQGGVAAGRRIAPAAEWLLDNYHLIEEQIQTCRRHLPPGYSRHLPWLTAGVHQGLPRVYAIALEFISHADGRLDLESLNQFVASYQSVAALTLGELWAIPIMLRLALLENLRRVAVGVCDRHRAVQAAHQWSQRLLEAEHKPALLQVVAALVAAHPALPAAFVAEFSRRLQGRGPVLAFALTWIEQRLLLEHQSIAGHLLADHQGQAADQASMANAITSQRRLSAIDWRDFVEAHSTIEEVLRGDPAAVYGQMDFATRDSYRHAVEALSRWGQRGETAVAQSAVALAAAVASDDPHAERRHVGYWLVGDGYLALAREVGAKPSPAMRWAQLPSGLRVLGALAPAALVTLGIVMVVLLSLPASSLASYWALLWMVPLMVLVALPVSQAALACSDRLLVGLLRPRLLPRLDFRAGIPSAWTTLVVVPAMLSRPQDIRALVDGLEIRALGNADPNLHYALLTDFSDAAHEVMPEDAALLQQARAAVHALNARHGHSQSDGGMGSFHLLHRHRRWNAQDSLWMGEERKRGKLHDLNRLLLADERQPFLALVGDTARLRAVTLVLTLDSDTQLPRSQAQRLVATMAHPLNRPVYDAQAKRVLRGYGVLQPQVAVSLPSTTRSAFAQLFAGEAGMDPYTRAISDVYQDVFGEGSFIGKGIYDVAAFSAATGDRFPDATILSHDLIEGCYARCGLVSDAILVEDQPSSYLNESRRRHRWMRGDWQLARWLLPWVPGRRSVQANPLSLLSRWKIADNLRRSLVAPSLFILFVAGWTILPGAAWAWTLLGLTLHLAPVFLRAVLSLLPPPPEVTFGRHLRSWGADVLHDLAVAGYGLMVLPYEAALALDAMIRSLWRSCLSRRKLLQWQTSEDSSRRHEGGLRGFVWAMAVAPLLGLISLILVVGWQPAALSAAAPLAVLWIGVPLVAWWSSRLRQRAASPIVGADLELLASIARRTWRYFTTFVTAKDHWLPPDNYQEYAVETVAHRTSPTNLGLALLANLAARDFGYISIAELLERCDNALSSMARLERHHGHFFNWYDTQTLQPLAPRYVSTVDSGNLAGHLLVLRAGFVELGKRPLLARHLPLCDTAHCLAEAVAASGPVRESLTIALRQLHKRCRTPVASLSALVARLGVMSRAAAAVADLLAEAEDEPRWWAQTLLSEAQELTRELSELVPWSGIGDLPRWPLHHPEESDPLHPLRNLLQDWEVSATLAAIATLDDTLQPLLRELRQRCADGDSALSAIGEWLCQLSARLGPAVASARRLLAAAAGLSQTCSEQAAMDWPLLYDRSRELFVIGLNVDDNRLDHGVYDLLASEARLGSFLAIAQDRVPQEHWFAMGRQTTMTGSGPALLSWSGSMFEYLMPQLVMPTYDGSLLDVSHRAVVARQITYGRQRGVPWGISESGYNRTDAQLVYQYRAFGVPGLGFRRGLADDLVIAPYASMMALTVAPAAACANLRRLHHEGAGGPYGFYEAIDYTPARLAEGRTRHIVRSYMVHHQGMSLLALVQVLRGAPMQRRFCADPQFKTALLLLQERALRSSSMVRPHQDEAAITLRAGVENEAAMRVYNDPHGAFNEVHLLSNGRYHVMVGAAGTGVSRWQQLAVNRWRDDPTLEQGGMLCYLHDPGLGTWWSATHQPSGQFSEQYEAIFTQSRAEFRRRDYDLECHTQISVSPEDDIELRRMTLTNRSQRARTIELTSYAEVVIAAQADDSAHPAFSKIFVQTEIDRRHDAILCTRRPRSVEETPPWMFHLMTVGGQPSAQASFETSRATFLGRGGSVAQPAALSSSGPLSDKAGAVLDPVVAIRRSLRLAAGESVTVDLVFGMAEDRATVEALVARYHDQHLCERVFGLSRTHGQMVLRQLGITEAEAQLYGHLAGCIIHATASRRAPARVLERNERKQAALWAYGISGDLPIVLLRVGDGERLELVRELMHAHLFWRAKGLAVDLVIWNEDHSVYRQQLHDRIADLIAAGPEAPLVDKPGGIFVRRSEQMSEEDRILLQTVARMVISDGDGSLAQFAAYRPPRNPLPPELAQPSVQQAPLPEVPVAIPDDLILGNGLGGFTADGREYIMTIDEGQNTPQPWVNVLANPDFGTVISESGGAYTWAGNSHEYRLTTWYNDPVSDPSGEAFYIRDEESGAFWSPTPAPSRGPGRYVVRHGFGYSAFAHDQNGLRSDMLVYVASDAPLKLITIRVHNHSKRPRRLSLTAYWELVLGAQRAQTGMHVVTSLDSASGLLLARNPYHAESSQRLTFAAVSESRHSLSGDRAEFIGRGGSLAAPAALTRQRLSGHLGAGLDPCLALMVPVELPAGESREIVFVLGSADSLDQARHLAGRFASQAGARHALEGVWQHWNRTLGVIQVDTPDPAVNILANGWLLYQVIACRLWARSGFFQSGGAFGFRDQLQDAMAVVQVAPWLLREQILRAAAHQFSEGDVQHWWHPPGGSGVRTQCSDDYLWLPAAVARYCQSTGDTGILDEEVSFLEGRPLAEGEEAYYDVPSSGARASLFEHCVRAINHGQRFGVHGLPLIGAGDWNDGMNRVGIEGRGESVWLGFFFHQVLEHFAPIAAARGDHAVAEDCWASAAHLQQQLDAEAWDGDWYLRAWFDDGTALGSHASDECQIDALPQSWAVLSAAGDPQRARQAMAAVDQRLVDRELGLIRLFAPPFADGILEPGYIKGYPPGIRENGGQYTHAAVWVAMAMAQLGDVDRAWELWSLINPVDKSSSAAPMQTYQAEPYVMAADVYALPGHEGRGGWTWYTGSAGWMYRLLTESLLGLRLEGESLFVDSLMPSSWDQFRVHYRFRDTQYHLRVCRGTQSEPSYVCDGIALTTPWLPVVDDRHEHQVVVYLSV